MYKYNQLEKEYRENNIQTYDDKIQYLKTKLNIWKSDNSYFHDMDSEEDMLKALEKIYTCNYYKIH